MKMDIVLQTDFGGDSGYAASMCRNNETGGPGTENI